MQNSIRIIRATTITSKTSTIATATRLTPVHTTTIPNKRFYHRHNHHSRRPRPFFFNNNNNNNTSQNTNTMPQLPTTSQVQPGANVSIILKADQRTGRQVQGVVCDVLTRGDHPRGIKVRLDDGRIGRVQGMSSSSSSNFNSVVDGNGASTEDNKPTVQRPKHSDVRFDEHLHSYSDGPNQRQEVDLLAYVKSGRNVRRRGGKNRDGNIVASSVEETTGEQVKNQHGGNGSGAVLKCPVCQTFEGDEAALNHHVQSHFDD